MSTSHGTGQPLYFICWAERRARARAGPTLRALHRHFNENHHQVQRTGRTRHPLSSRIGGARVLDYDVEVLCLTCGHKGWSRHVQAARLPLWEPNLDSKS